MNNNGLSPWDMESMEKKSVALIEGRAGSLNSIKDKLKKAGFQVVQTLRYNRDTIPELMRMMEKGFRPDFILIDRLAQENSDFPMDEILKGDERFSEIPVLQISIPGQ